MKFGDMTEADLKKATESKSVWFKTFRPGDNQLRLCTPPSGFLSILTHFDSRNKLGYPCASGTGRTCIGCDSNDDNTRNRSRKWIFHAYDSAGRKQVFVVGKRTYDRLSMLEGRKGAEWLLDRDIIIVRIKTGESKTDVDYDVVTDIDTPIKIDTSSEAPRLLDKLDEIYDYALNKLGDTSDDQSNPFSDDRPPTIDLSELTTPNLAKLIQEMDPEYKIPDERVKILQAAEVLLKRHGLPATWSAEIPF